MDDTRRTGGCASIRLAADEAGEFRAPGHGHGFDGPGGWRWMCLDHVREFNAGYDWFEGMSAEEILHAQAPSSGWRTESRPFAPNAGVDGMPRWTDYDDPLGATRSRRAHRASRAEALEKRQADLAMDGRFSKEEAKALDTMGLGQRYWGD